MTRSTPARPGEKLEADYQKMFDGYAAAYPELASELKRRIAG